MERASPWRQFALRFSDRHTAEQNALDSLGPALLRAETTGLLTSWSFIRKKSWRFRYMPTDTPGAAALLHEAANELRARGHIAHYAETIYEPETHAFGGERAMSAAHDLFHADSRRIFTDLSQLGDGAPGRRVQRRELSILLCAALARASGLDWYEQGDVWAKVVALRPARTAPTPEWERFRAAVRQLLTTDSAPHTLLREGALNFADGWLTAFEQAGRTLRALADEGLLTRGLRAVIAHHVIFHWNRIGLPATAQVNIALAAKEAVFSD
ncbi:thiopeptide-type bacteriocin biosynthesis protein [Nonomuraea sp. 3N208]|uniref:thiopeptide-type bacteriocin biosynthesis protein n=1 Tax=Nonomuraea sp. 3N208 TaxID=3457421 RepID=UPI003FCFF248